MEFDVMNWILDIGATNHMTHRLQSLYNVKKISNSKVNLPNGSCSFVTHIGDHVLKRQLDIKGCTVYSWFHIQLTYYQFQRCLMILTMQLFFIQNLWCFRTSSMGLQFRLVRSSMDCLHVSQMLVVLISVLLRWMYAWNRLIWRGIKAFEETHLFEWYMF